MNNIVFLDTETIGKVDNMKLLSKLGNLETFDNTGPDQVVERCQGKEIVIVNKVQMTEALMKQLPDLKLICVAATGVNNVALNYAENNGIKVKNVAGYSTDSVAQLTFTMLLYLINKPYYYDSYVKSGAYSRSDSFTHHNEPFWELKGKRLGHHWSRNHWPSGGTDCRIVRYGSDILFYHRKEQPHQLQTI